MRNHSPGIFRIALMSVVVVGPGCTAQTDSSNSTPSAEESRTVQVSENTFASEVERATEPLVLVDFWATWCGPCKMIAPSLENLAGEYAGRVKICKVDVDRNEGLARRFSASSIPLVICFKNGVQIDKILGARPESAYRQWIEENL